MVTKKEVSEFLNSPAESIMPLGIFAFLGGAALWIVVPIILFSLGAGFWIAWQLLPFIVSAIVMFTFYWLFGKFDVKEPARTILPILFGIVALVPLFIPQTKSLIVGQVAGQAQAMGILTGFIDLSTKTFLVIPVVAILIFLAIGLKALLDLGRPGAFFAGVLGIALGIAMTTGVAGLGMAQTIHPTGTDTGLTITDVEGSHLNEFDIGTRSWHWKHKGDWYTPSDTAEGSFTVAPFAYVNKDEESLPGNKVRVTKYYESSGSCTFNNDKFGPGLNHTTHLSISATWGTIDWVELTVTKSGPVEISPTGKVGTPLSIKTVSRGGDGTTNFKLQMATSKTVTEEESKEVEEPVEPGGGETMGFPNLFWIITLAGIAPAAIIYAGEEEKWW